MRFFLFLSVFLTQHFLCAQSTLGLQVGVDYTQVKIFEFHKAPFNNILNEGFSYPGLLFGIRGEHHLFKKTILELSISYTEKKGIARNYWGEDPDIFEHAIQFKSLLSSVKMKYEIFKNTLIGVGVANRFISNAHTIQNSGSKLYASYNKTNLAFLLSLGYYYNDFAFEVNYLQGKKLELDRLSKFFDYVESLNTIDFRIIYHFEI